MPAPPIEAPPAADRPAADAPAPVTGDVTDVVRSDRSLWRDGDFLRFWGGQGVSQIGSSVGRIALPVLAVSVLDATAFQVGLLDAVQFAAFLLIGLPAGAWVDRWRKRRTMIAADAVRAVAMLAIPVLWWTGSLDFWHLLAVAAVVGTATVFFDVGYQSFVPVLVPSGRVADANGKLEATAQVARLGGPGIGGALLSVVSVPVLFVAEAVGYLVSAIALITVRDSERRPDPPQEASLIGQIRAGLSFVVRHPLISRITAATGISNFFSTVAATLYPILILRELGLGAPVFGLIMSLGAVGGVLGAALASRIGDRVGEGNALPLSLVASTVLMLLMPAATLMPAPWLQITALSVADFGFSVLVVVYNVLQVSMRQRVCPPALLGRMNASIRCLVWGVMPIGALLGGWLGGWIGIVPTILIGVVGAGTACVPLFFSPLWGMRRLPS
ncbi:MFS transporter [Tersicoccus sp. Bi-70]|uniref:MFS transporter n=1 Tax=Tersicoccus sp. Bi-70 TaxID=1897634 RepID=UPI001E6042D7|nr:MFS transporter [Tersicoccus sp. Bi-70]